MKRFIVFLLLGVFLFSISFFKNSFDFSKMKNLSVQVFTSDKQICALDDIKTVDNGEGQILFCNYEQYQLVSGLYKNISGVTFVFDGNKQLFNEIINSLKIKMVEENSSDFLGYTNNFDSAVSYCGKKVNVQGYYNDGKIYIGTPLLLGSY